MNTLFLYDYTDNAIRSWGYAADYCEDYSYLAGRCEQENPDTLAAGVASIDDVIGWIGHHGKRHGPFDALVFLTHGSPGKVYLPNGSIHSGNVDRLEKVCSKHLVVGATVMFCGCNVGEGMWGTTFFNTAGKAMLGQNGGWMYACESWTLSVPLFGQKLPLWGNCLYVKVDPGGNVGIPTKANF